MCTYRSCERHVQQGGRGVRQANKILIAVAMSFIFTIGLTIISDFMNPDIITKQGSKKEQARQEDSQAVISLAYGSILNDRNLVDYMAGMQLNLGIRKLDWREPMLYVDLYVKDRHIDRQDIFADVQKIGLFSLQGMKNVNNIFLRVYDNRHREASLLLAVSADANQMKDSLQSLQDEVNGSYDSRDYEKFVRDRYRVQQTHRWSEWFDQQQ